MSELGGERWASPRRIQEVECTAIVEKNSEAEKIQRAKWLLRRAFRKPNDVVAAPWVLHPDSRLRKIMTSAAFTASVYTVFVEAYLVSFDVRPLPTFTLLLSCFADMVLAADFAANFMTGYKWLASDGTWHLDMRPIPSIINYLTTWCFIDAWGILPIQLIFTLVDPFGRLLYPAPMFLRILQVLKCLKIFRIVSELRSWENNSATHFGSLTLLRSVGGFLLLVHWWACAWFWTVKESERILALYPEDPSVCTDRMKLLEAEDGDQYLCALYWAVQIISTTGNGDMVPQTDVERSFSLIAMIVGACLFLIFIVTIHAVEADARSHHQRFQDEVNATTEYLRSRNIPQILLKEMDDHYRYQWKMSKGYDDIACLSRLPLSVQMRAFQLMHGALVSSVDFLSVRPPSDMAFWGMFLEELRAEIVAPKTWLFREGDPADCIYMVKDGLVHVFQEATGFVFEACPAGSWFGETSVSAPRGRAASARTLGHCSLLVLPEAGAARLCAAFPDVRDSMEAACRWRMRRQTAARWKIMWQRHRFLILEMAALIPRPPPPWPYPPTHTRSGKAASR